MANFTVDTHVFRELGELLVGRDSTALIELIKNAYDADATQVTVHGEYLDDPKRGKIIISDDGIGMTPDQFTDGFLRIASRLKEGGNRTSLKFKRRYTGAKGIGRLAAHKLARSIHIISVPWEKSPGTDKRVVNATIDWDLVESKQTLDDLEGSGAITLGCEPRNKNVDTGTIIRLQRLRQRWSPNERARFLTEVQNFYPPLLLVDFPKGAVSSPLLFSETKITSTESTSRKWGVKLTGEFEEGEEYWQSLVQVAQWMIEINALQPSGKVKINIVPTKNGRKVFPKAERMVFSVDHPTPKTGPFFQSRILIREQNPSASKTERLWLGSSYGIRVYMEGFRVLPYGEPGNDWLSLDAQYKKRGKTLGFLNNLGIGEDIKEEDEVEGLSFLGNSSYFGAVFLTLKHSPTFQMLVNREGFVPVREYHSLESLLQTAIYLSVRVRASASKERRETRRIARKEKTIKSLDSSRLSLREAVENSVERASELAAEATKLAARGQIKAARKQIDHAAAVFRKGGQISQRIITEPAMLRVLASVGTQMTAFVHEINALLGSSIALEGTITKIQEEKGIPVETRRHLQKLQGAVGDLRRSVERQASYLTDVVSPDSRRRRSRQSLWEKFESGCRLVLHQSQQRSIRIINDIPQSLKSPPMFPAELTIIFSNLLTNAVKAAGRGGKILAKARSESNGDLVIRIENTGITINPGKGERWFEPFESTTVKTDPVLGQGMGMGLPITRKTIEEYGGTIKFVKPSTKFRTAIEIRFEE